MSRNQGETINKIITTDWRQFPLCKWPLRIVANGHRDEARAAATDRAIKLANWLTKKCRDLLCLWVVGNWVEGVRGVVG